MAAELSAALVDAALQLAGIAEQGADEPAPDDDRLLPERSGAHNVLSYAVAGEAETYRRIMRILYLEHQAFGLRLRPAQIADRLRERYALGLDTELLDQRLGALDTWGAVERDHDASLASSAAEWRRNRYTYDVPPAGRLTEELPTRLDALGEEIERLDTARLPCEPRSARKTRPGARSGRARWHPAASAAGARSERGRGAAHRGARVHALSGRPDANRRAGR